MKTKKILVGCLAAIGAFTLGDLGVQLALNRLPYSISADDVYLSPDQKFKALSFSSWGRDGISPYCDATISVMPAPLTYGLSDKRYEVFSTRCNSLTGNHEILSKIEWLSNNVLQVTLAVSSEAEVDVRLKGMDESDQVTVQFVTSD